MTEIDPNSPDLVRSVTAHLVARRAYANEVGEIVTAPCGWSVATVGEDGKVNYAGIVGFVIGSTGVRSAITIAPYDAYYSAIVDPSSGRYVAIHDGKTFEDEAAFVQAMQVVREFDAAAPSAETTAH